MLQYDGKDPDVMDEAVAGVDRESIEYVMRNDSDVLLLERVPDATAMWKIVVKDTQGRPVDMILDNGINEIYLQALKEIDSDHIVDALSSVAAYATVGLVIMGGNLYMRSAIFPRYSDLSALTNMYTVLAYAYESYQRAIL